MLFLLPCLDASPASSTGAGGRSSRAPPRARHGTPGPPAVRQDDVGSITEGRAFLRPRRSEEPGPAGRTANCPGGFDRHRRDRRSAAQTGSLSTAPRPCGPPASCSIPAARQRLAGPGEGGLRESRRPGRVPRPWPPGGRRDRRPRMAQAVAPGRVPAQLSGRRGHGLRSCGGKISSAATWNATFPPSESPFRRRPCADSG